MRRKSNPLTKAERLQRLLHISTVLSSTLDLPQLLHAIVELACEFASSETACILLYDSDLKQLRLAIAPGFQGSNPERLTIPLDDSAAGRVFSSRRPLVIQDAASDRRVLHQVDRSLGFETRSMLVVPLMIKQEPIGVLEAVNKLQQGHYTEDDVEFLEILAAQAAIAIENARLLRELQTANIELKRLDLMKSDFVAITSHELRTPLGLIMGHATFLKEIVPQECVEPVEAITRSAMRLKSIVEDLSSIAHKEKGESRIRRSSFSMGDLAREVSHHFSPLASEKPVDLLVKLPKKDPLTIAADQEKIKVALSHIVRNAISFTDPGGTVTIHAEKENGFVKVTVRDTGIGIPQNDVVRVFDRFFQVESHLTRRHGGMGLGLAIAKTMVEMHGGRIWCESKEGVGSKFAFVIPQAVESSEAAAKALKTA